MQNKEIWESHYNRNKSILLYPDENLVRMVKKDFLNNDPSKFYALDIGSGSARHSQLLRNCGVKHVYNSDMAFNSIKFAFENLSIKGVNCFNQNMPFKDLSFDICIAWGSLHYSDKLCTKDQIHEIHRILKKGGTLYGTLRSEFDTHLKKGQLLSNNTYKSSLSDLNTAKVSFFSEIELCSLFKNFSSFEYGIIERTELNKIEHRISHWYYRAIK